MLFCVAGAPLCDIPACLITCRKSFCVAGAPTVSYVSMKRAVRDECHDTCPVHCVHFKTF